MIEIAPMPAMPSVTASRYRPAQRLAARKSAVLLTWRRLMISVAVSMSSKAPTIPQSSSCMEGLLSDLVFRRSGLPAG